MQFLKGLDFESVATDAGVEEDDEEDEEDEEEDEEDEDEEDEEGEQEDSEEESEEESEDESEEDVKPAPTKPTTVKPAPIIESTKPEVPEYKMKSGLQVNPDSRIDVSRRSPPADSSPS